MTDYKDGKGDYYLTARPDAPKVCPECGQWQDAARPSEYVDDIIHDPGCRGGHTEEEQCAALDGRREKG